MPQQASASSTIETIRRPRFLIAVDLAPMQEQLMCSNAVTRERRIVLFAPVLAKLYRTQPRDWKKTFEKPERPHASDDQARDAGGRRRDFRRGPVAVERRGVCADRERMESIRCSPVS